MDGAEAWLQALGKVVQVECRESQTVAEVETASREGRFLEAQKMSAMWMELGHPGAEDLEVGGWQRGIPVRRGVDARLHRLVNEPGRRRDCGHDQATM